MKIYAVRVLSSLKIGTRLSLGFFAILLLMIGVTVAGLSQVAEISNTLDQISEVNNLKSRYAVNFRGSVHDRAIALRDVVLSGDNEEAARSVAQIRRLAGSYAESAEKLDRMFAERADVTERERAALSHIKSSESTTVPLIEKVVELQHTGADAEAKRILLSDARPAFVEWLRTINHLIDLEEEMSQKGALHAREIAQTFHVLMLALCTTAAIAGLAVAWQIKRSIVRPISDAAGIVRRVANGDLSIQVRTTTRDEVGTLLQELNSMTESLASMVARVREASGSTGAASRQIAMGNAVLSERLEIQAASLEETARNMKQLTETVKQNADNAQQANMLARTAAELADEGNEAVQTMVGTIGRISDSSAKISEITDVIESIAFQTNILALNASVEAARAGSQGRGFAVVASEVRSLAQRCAAAAKEIAELIGTSVAVIHDGAAQASEAGATMGQVKLAIKQVSDIVGNIAFASEDQRQGIEQVNEAVVQMDEVTQQNAVVVEQAAAAAKSLEKQATDLNVYVCVFKLASEDDHPRQPAADVSTEPLVPTGQESSGATRSEAVIESAGVSVDTLLIQPDIDTRSRR